VLDVCVGIDPALVGQEHDLRFATAVVDYYRTTTGAGRLRAVVQAWNERGVRLTRPLGFARRSVTMSASKTGSWSPTRSSSLAELVTSG
jgi:hypothetical protein